METTKGLLTTYVDDVLVKTNFPNKITSPNIPSRTMETLEIWIENQNIYINGMSKLVKHFNVYVLKSFLYCSFKVQWLFAD